MSNRTSLNNNYYIISDDIAHPAPLSFWLICANLLLNRQSLILTTNATMQVFTSNCYMLAKGDVEML